MSPPAIALVTITFNALGVWDDFWTSLTAQRDVDWQLYVVDNQSRDGTRDMLAALDDPRVKIILNDDNVGVAAGNNQGIKAAIADGADYIGLVNNDVTFSPTLLSDLRDTIMRQNADAVSPLIPYYDHPDMIWYGGGSFRRLRGVRNTHDHANASLSTVGQVPFETQYAPTCCVLFRRDVFDRIGLMDERYFVYWDDTDFLWRMRMADMKLVVDPLVLLYHKVSIATGGRLSDFSLRYNFRNQIFFARKFHGNALAAYTALVESAAGVARVVLRGDTIRHLKLRLRALREGFSMECGPAR